MEPIAIVGLSFKLPQGVENESDFWDILEQGKNLMTPWPKSRANVDAFFESHTARRNTISATGAHFLAQDPTTFDAPFFSISPREAASMDPQQRMLLEAAYHALENAGIPVGGIAGTKTGVFSGSMESDYYKIISKDPDEAPANTATGASVSILANRLSWYFDLNGPSMQVNTACSSSMIAMDLACQSLRCGQSSMALVTGSNLMLSPELSIYLSSLNMLSPESISYTFDHRANGYSRGEGVIVLVLKSLSSAIRNADNIRAIIRATGSNQDGRTPGITHPSSISQENLIRQVYSSCNLGFESTRYVEAHGTGTHVGDSTEMKAIGAVFRHVRSPKAPLYVGSVKTNVGHLEGGSGLAGILKCILVLEKAVIPPNALFERLNKKLNARQNNVEVLESCVSWPTGGLRRVSVNSFGFGGSNAHVIMDDTYHTLEILSLNTDLYGIHTSTLPWPVDTNGNTKNSTMQAYVRETEELPRDGDLNSEFLRAKLNGTANMSIDTLDEVTFGGANSCSRANGATEFVKSTAGCKYQLLVYSGRDKAALNRVLLQYSKYYDDCILGSSRRLRELAYILAERRSKLAWRSFAMGDANLPSHAIGLPDTNCIRASLEMQLCFVFTGQGAQYSKMGLELIQYPVFMSNLQATDKVFQGMGADWSLFDKIESEDDIKLPQFSQPLCTALQIALFELLKSFNVSPVAVIGHSSGEIAAAYAVGALSLESACKVAYHRGRLSGLLAASTEPGAMMSVNLQEGNFHTYADKALPGANIFVACVNSPSNITLAGLEVDIDKLKLHLDNDGIFARKLKTGLAYHTPVMRNIASEYLCCLGVLEGPKLHDNAMLMVSSVTGQRATPTELSKGQYWVDNLTSPVRFVDALQYLTQAAPKLDGMKAISDYIEIGPHGALRRPLLETLDQISNGKEFRYASVLSKLHPPLRTMMETAGHLFAHGHSISITAVNQQVAGMGASPILTDLPQYPFDRSQQYWYESRLSRDWRLRESAPRHVLGIRSSDWNPLEPRWRKMLSIEEAPWIADHVIDGAIIFPAAGSVVMGLEAVRQMVPKHQTISGYLVKEATFSSPIFVHSEKKTEVLTHLRALQYAYERTSLRFEVVIYSLDNDGNAIECFKGIIHAHIREDVSSEVDGGFEARVAEQVSSQNYENAKLSCTRHVSKKDFYKWLNEQGLAYGDAFALADEIFWNGHELCMAHVDNSQEPYEGVVHPAVLDTCLQLVSLAPSEGISKTLSTFIPHRMKDTWISAIGWQYPQTHSIRIQTQSRLNTSSTALNCSFTVLADDESLLCHAKHISMSIIAHKTSTDDGQKQLLHSIKWKPQLSLLNAQQLSDYCDADQFVDDETFAIDYYIRLEDILRSCLERKWTQLREAVTPETPPHLRNYLSWIEMQLCKKSSHFPDIRGDEHLSEELENLRVIRPSWRMFIDVVQALPSVIRGETNALDLLSSTPLAQDFNDDFVDRICNHKLFSYLELATHQNPGQRILEVGAGTGALTNRILNFLHRIEQQTGGIAFSEYVYTDVSPTYFGEARERFGAYRDRMTFMTLDLEHDMSACIEPGTYDILLAGSVLHATKNLSGTLRNLRRALKPGGQLIFVEVTAPDCFVISLGFGILPGWWCGEEDSRAWCPTITEPEWDILLRDNGFSGNDLVIRDYKDERARCASIIVSSAERSLQTVVKGLRTLVVVHDQDENQKSLALNLIHGVLSSSGYHPIIVTLSWIEDAEVSPTDRVVFLADIGGSMLAEPSEDTFRLIQHWIHQSKHLLWITASTFSKSSYSYSGLKDGFLRVMRSENDSKRIISLSLEDDTFDTLAFLKQIGQVFHLGFEIESSDLEYIVRNGRILTGRLIREVELNKDLISSIHPQIKYEAWLPGPPIKLNVGTRGSLDTLHFIEDEHRAELGPRDIEIENQAWAISFRDVFGALGRLDENEFGTDCAGVVKRVGSQCNELRSGDRVCASSFGCMRTFVDCHELDVVKIPDSLSVEEACAVINPGMTAWYCIVDVARLARGEKILIHAAAGATGQVAVQIAKMIGAEIFATVGYDHKKQLLMDEYGIPASHIFYSRDLSFAQGIMRITQGYGVDVVLNSLTGEGLRASWECVAPYGRFIEIGKADIHANTPLPMACFASNVSFSAVDLRHLSFNRMDLIRNLFHKTMSLVRDGIICCPKPLHTYSVSAIEQAFRYMQSGKNTGRVVVRVEHSAEVQKHLISHRTWCFDGDATYLVAGGLGGVGRSILRWMASNGAKQLIVPSRSGAASKAAMEVVSELTKMGVRIVTPRCDISVASSVHTILEDYAQLMSPIRGCINATMVLRDSIFENMTRVQWESTIRSKVQSSWNLHNLLPRDLDFFILLSSVSGIIGNAGQSNYAAGCTFQDSLAQFRVYHGQNAVSIDLGPMRAVGVVAENKGLMGYYEKYPGLTLIEEEELHSLLSILCSPEYHPPSSTARSQISMGLVTPAELALEDNEDLPLEHMKRSLFAYFSQTGAASGKSVSTNSVDSKALFRQAENEEKMTSIVVESLVRKLVRALFIKAEDVHPDQSLTSYGVDSLIAVELRNWGIKEFAADVPVFEFMSGKTAVAIGQLVTKTSRIRKVS